MRSLTVVLVISLFAGCGAQNVQVRTQSPVTPDAAVTVDAETRVMRLTLNNGVTFNVPGEWRIAERGQRAVLAHADYRGRIAVIPVNDATTQTVAQADAHDVDYLCGSGICTVEFTLEEKQECSADPNHDPRLAVAVEKSDTPCVSESLLETFPTHVHLWVVNSGLVVRAEYAVGNPNAQLVKFDAMQIVRELGGLQMAELD